MLHSVTRRKRPLTVVSSPSRASKPTPRARRPASASAQSVSALRSAHGCLLAPLMRAAGGVMGWRLQHDGFKARDINVSGGGHVRIWDAPGTGPAACAVFIHGLGGSSCEYRDTLVWLQSRCRRVIAVDMPGHGNSTAMGRETRYEAGSRHRVIDKFQGRINLAVDAVLDEPAHVVGHSLGGYAAMRYALEGEKRHRVRGLVLVSPDGAPWTPRELAEDCAMFEVPDYTKAADIAARTYPDNATRAALVAPFLYARFATPEMQYLNHSDAKQPALRPAQVAALPARLRLIVGKQERFDPPHNLVWFKAHMPAGMTLRQPNTGHGAIVDAHPEVLAAMADFLI